MGKRLEFQEKLSGILIYAREQGNKITQEQAEQYFEEDNLSKEQMELVFDYLLSQEIVVNGYQKQKGTITEGRKEEEPHKPSKEEQVYLADYLASLNDTKMEDTKMQMYLIKAAELAQELYHPEIFIGDMIQEGNVSLILALEQYRGKPDEEALVMEEVRARIQMVAESQAERKRRDQKIVEQVAKLDEQIKGLSEEMGRKISVEEVADQMGMTEEQIADVLKLSGEDIPVGEES